MKLGRLIILSILSCFLTSCELMGIDVSTIKGKWVSDLPQNGISYSLEIDDDSFILNSGNVNQIRGTWSQSGDTLNMFQQTSPSKKSSETFIIKQLSMDRMTLLDEANNILIFNRVYSDNANSEADKFNEVWDLKKGFLWHCKMIVSLGFLLLIIICIGKLIFKVFSHS